ncbi:hypothetical protein [Pseudomonas oryzihabitans]|uniref:hypothetical protein n=1 Tax=Pseudomonas oryzihabitans TaxID=47885 RepID=UPI001ABF5D23|nr:hypothetical protein [Pseudomonas oryzihabitans]
MAKETSKRTTSASRAAGIQAALEKIAASGLVQRLAEDKSEGAYEAEKAMEHGNFARPHFTKTSGTVKFVVDKNARSYIHIGSVDVSSCKTISFLSKISEVRPLNASITESAVTQQKSVSVEGLYYYEALRAALSPMDSEVISDDGGVLIVVDLEKELPLPRYVSFGESYHESDYLDGLRSLDVVAVRPDNHHVMNEYHLAGRGRKR